MVDENPLERRLDAKVKWTFSEVGRYGTYFRHKTNSRSNDSIVDGRCVVIVKVYVAIFCDETAVVVVGRLLVVVGEGNEAVGVLGA